MRLDNLLHYVLCTMTRLDVVFPRFRVKEEEEPLKMAVMPFSETLSEINTPYFLQHTFTLIETASFPKVLGIPRGKARRKYLRRY